MVLIRKQEDNVMETNGLLLKESGTRSAENEEWFAIKEVPTVLIKREDTIDMIILDNLIAVEIQYQQTMPNSTYRIVLTARLLNNQLLSLLKNTNHNWYITTEERFRSSKDGKDYLLRTVYNCYSMDYSYKLTAEGLPADFTIIFTGEKI